jgi:hypothetical protein
VRDSVEQSDLTFIGINGCCIVKGRKKGIERLKENSTQRREQRGIEDRLNHTWIRCIRIRRCVTWPLTKQNNRRCHNIYSCNKKISHHRENCVTSRGLGEKILKKLWPSPTSPPPPVPPVPPQKEIHFSSFFPEYSGIILVRD